VVVETGLDQVLDRPAETASPIRAMTG
jgi:hypothetical protein